MTVAQLLVFLPVAVLVALSPGANNLLAFVNGTRAGLGPAVRALAGRCAAFAIMIALAALGLGALLETSELAFGLLKWAGVAYLVWLGVSFWRRVPEHPLAPAPNARLARREFLTAMGNPKAYLLFTVFVPQFVTGTGSYALQLAVLGGVYVAVEAAAAILWAGAGAWAGKRALTDRRRAWMNRVSGGLMIGAAGALARSERAA